MECMEKSTRKFEVVGRHLSVFDLSPKSEIPRNTANGTCGTLSLQAVAKPMDSISVALIFSWGFSLSRGKILSAINYSPDTRIYPIGIMLGHGGSHELVCSSSWPAIQRYGHGMI